MSQTLAYTELVDMARLEPPRIAVVLGSGWSELAQKIDRPRSVPFQEVPGLEATTVPGHKGCLTLGSWAGQSVLLFEGRLHFYEGQAWSTVVMPVRLARDLGAGKVLVTNAAGGIRADLEPGSWLAISDHIDWARPFLCGEPGPAGLKTGRSSPYSARLLALLRQAARELDMALPSGIYAQVTGPCYETPAEIRALRSLGADAVGMSTAREVEAARALGLECAGLSCITNRAAGLSPAPIHHEEVLQAAASQRQRLGALLERFLRLV